MIETRGGGVVNLYRNNKIAYKIKDDPLMINLETLWIDLLLPNTKPITVGVCYKPPDYKPFLDELNSKLTSLDTSRETIILGDMNICYNNHNSGITNQYKQILDLNSYKQTITIPTRVTEHTANILDHIICNREDRITHSGVIEIGISDHFLTYCTRKHKKVSIGRHKTIKIRSLRNYNKDIFENILHNTNWDLIYSKTDDDDAWTTFKTIITEIMDEVAPMKEVGIKK